MKKHYYILLSLFFVFISSCSDDENEVMVTEDTISITDANAITSGITITGSTIVDGNPPSPSTDDNAPKLFDAENVVGITGNSLYLSIDQETSNSVGGIYLKVVGADSYFDIPSSALGNSGGRIGFGKNGRAEKAGRIEKTNEDVAVGIEIPDGLQPGIFCVEYCIYDVDNLISNIVEVCIEIKAFGGEGSEFLIKAWEAVKLSGSETYQGQTDTWEELIGETQTNTYTDNNFWCESTQSYVTLTYEDVSRTDYIYLEFISNGAMSIDEKYYEKYLSDLNACSQADLTYSVYDEIYSTIGAWAYDATSSVLTLVIEDEYEECTYDDLGNEISCQVIKETYAIEFDLIMQGDNLKLVNEEVSGTDSYRSEIEFKPKN